MKTEQILLAHGNGGLLTQELVGQCFARYFTNAILDPLEDAAILMQQRRRLAFTTDSYVGDPLFLSAKISIVSSAWQCPNGDNGQRSCRDRL